jgi:hypothetical protein
MGWQVMPYPTAADVIDLPISYARPQKNNMGLKVTSAPTHGQRRMTLFVLVILVNRQFSSKRAEMKQSFLGSLISFSPVFPMKTVLNGRVLFQ